MRAKKFEIIYNKIEKEIKKLKRKTPYYYKDIIFKKNLKYAKNIQKYIICNKILKKLTLYMPMAIFGTKSIYDTCNDTFNFENSLAYSLLSFGALGTLTFLSKKRTQTLTAKNIILNSKLKKLDYSPYDTQKNMGIILPEPKDIFNDDDYLGKSQIVDLQKSKQK